MSHQTTHIDSKSILRAEGLVKSYSGRKVVNDVSFYVKPGEVVGLLGPNGAGKTTSFYAVVGLVNAEKGSVVLGDDELTHLPMHSRAKKGIGYLPQESSIFRDLSVEDNITAILELQNMSNKDRLSRLEELLEEFGLQRVRRSYGKVLSGGERRRTEIARALACDPTFILLDEPFAGVDPIAVEDIQNIVLKISKKGIGVLITDHNVQETLHITHRAYLLFEGKILKEGTAETLAADEHVRRVYLGRNFVLRS